MKKFVAKFTGRADVEYGVIIEAESEEDIQKILDDEHENKDGKLLEELLGKKACFMGWGNYIDQDIFHESNMVLYEEDGTDFAEIKYSNLNPPVLKASDFKEGI